MRMFLMPRWSSVSRMATAFARTRKGQGVSGKSLTPQSKASAKASAICWQNRHHYIDQHPTGGIPPISPSCLSKKRNLPQAKSG